MSVDYPPGINTTPRLPTELEIKATRRALILRRIVIGLVAVAVTLTLAVSSVGVVLIRSTQIGNKSTLDTTKRTARQVASCTTPGRPCYKRGQQATAAAVSQILDESAKSQAKASAAAAACAAAGLTEYEDIYRCVKRRLAQQD